MQCSVECAAGKCAHSDRFEEGPPIGRGQQAGEEFGPFVIVGENALVGAGDRPECAFGGRENHLRALGAVGGEIVPGQPGGVGFAVVLRQRRGGQHRGEVALVAEFAEQLGKTELLQNGGVGDQLPKVLDEKLQRIEANQTRLTELAASEYTKRNEESVRAAAVKKYMKANKHDPDFVEEAKAAYVQKKEGTIKAAAAELYMEAHAEDEDFREEAVEAYTSRNSDRIH